ncbi:MAG: DmsE family decaheme c-type cytochrome [Gammaproteobacteria bacterium]|nr:DmsE family decaheme c-type cytochrome [Gammaproteobacteria bacterium]
MKIQNVGILPVIPLLLYCIAALADPVEKSATAAENATATGETAPAMSAETVQPQAAKPQAASADSDQPAAADNAMSVTRPPVIEEYSKKGADTCLKCHDEDSEYPVLDIFKTKHGVKADPRTPFASLQCETCHGPGVKATIFMEEAKKAGSHVGKVRPGEKRPPILNFGVKSDEPVAEQNRMCLGCHKGGQHIYWQGSVHDNGEIACANCHTIHAVQDPVLDRATQADVCYRCHQQQRAEFFKPSNHPVRFGQLKCSDCHAVHGSNTASLLVKPTLNQTCYTCHAEKRGPFLWEHAPASEDCMLCHTAHGSIHPALLKKRPPLLCQQCHSQAGHPSVARTTAGLPGGNPSGFLLAGSCTNCHSQVHGSNHPSGVKMMR